MDDGLRRIRGLPIRDALQVRGVSRSLDATDLEACEAAFLHLLRAVGGTVGIDDTVPARTLIYPLDYTFLDDAQFDALAHAARAIGESEAFVVEIDETDPHWASTSHHSWIPLELEAYRELAAKGILTHALLSKSGSWVVRTSFDRFALGGGEQGFIGDMTAHLPRPPDRMVEDFVSDMRELGAEGGADVTWVLPILENVLGDRRAHELWAVPT